MKFLTSPTDWSGKRRKKKKKRRKDLVSSPSNITRFSHIDMTESETHSPLQGLQHSQQQIEEQLAQIRKTTPKPTPYAGRPLPPLVSSKMCSKNDHFPSFSLQPNPSTNNAAADLQQKLDALTQELEKKNRRIEVNRSALAFRVSLCFSFSIRNCNTTLLNNEREFRKSPREFHKRNLVLLIEQWPMNWLNFERSIVNYPKKIVNSVNNNHHQKS